MVNIEFTLKKFPVNGKLKDECGLPFSCVVQPFAKDDKTKSETSNLAVAASLARCDECYSYINGYCLFHASGWECSLCGAYNDYKPQTAKRYNSSTIPRSSLPELNANSVELVCPDFSEGDSSGEGQRLQVPVSGDVACVYIALVDTCCEDDYLELVRSALLAALEALPPCALFGLITISSQIGLHDIKGGTPVLRSIPLLGPEGVLGAELQDVMPLGTFLAEVGEYKEALSQAIELLEPDASFLRTSTPASTQHGPVPPPEPASMQRTQVAKRGYGPALQAILQYLKTRARPTSESGTFLSEGEAGAAAGSSKPAMGPAHLLSFLSGPPDLGVGKIWSDTPVPPAGIPLAASPAAGSSNGGGVDAGAGTSKSIQADQVGSISSSTRMFYEQAAVAAASLLVTVDLFAVGPATVGLQLMEALVNSTGGGMFLYPSVEDSALPQDVYRRLSTPHAHSCLLRVRTSPEFQVVRTYGRIFPDPQHQNLHHTLCCDPSDCFGFDFEFTSPVGFSSGDATPPTIQVAFQYSVVTQQDTSQRGGSVDSAKDEAERKLPRYVMQRRLRVLTIRLYVASTAADVYQNASPEVVMAVLSAKIMKVVKLGVEQAVGGPTTHWAQGVQKGRLLLQDWLIVFTADYHKHVHKDLDAKAAAETMVDMTFAKCQPLQSIPRLVYAMLRSPLLALTSPPPDLTAFISHLWCTLPPVDLLKAMYPCLSSYKDPNTQAWPRHSLSSAALLGADAPIFLMDAYIVVICHYMEACPPSVPFPPPQQSLLRKAIAQIKQERRITPQVRIQREGADDTTLFYQLLLDEGEVIGEGDEAVAQGSLPQFLDFIRGSIQTHLIGEAAGKAP